MKIENKDIVITMSIQDATSLRGELKNFIHDFGTNIQCLSGYFDEANLREVYPKLNEFLNILKVRDDLPF